MSNRIKFRRPVGTGLRGSKRIKLLKKRTSRKKGGRSRRSQSVFYPSYLVMLFFLLEAYVSGKRVGKSSSLIQANGLRASGQASRLSPLLCSCYSYYFYFFLSGGVGEFLFCFYIREIGKRGDIFF